MRERENGMALQRGLDGEVPQHIPLILECCPKSLDQGLKLGHADFSVRRAPSTLKGVKGRFRQRYLWTPPRFPEELVQSTILTRAQEGLDSLRNINGFSLKTTERAFCQA